GSMSRAALPASRQRCSAKHYLWKRWPFARIPLRSFATARVTSKKPPGHEGGQSKSRGDESVMLRISQYLSKAVTRRGGVAGLVMPGLLMVAVASSALAQTGAPTALPQPEPAFKGKIGRTVKESTPDFPKEVQAPAAAPNVLLILTDDVGFGASSTFGGPIPTPTMDALAKNGLRYNQFHTTALCSPTRAALITGRNHHTAATGNIMEFATGYPG